MAPSSPKRLGAVVVDSPSVTWTASDATLALTSEGVFSAPIIDEFSSLSSYCASGSAKDTTGS
jgi:hypothetical protein